MHPIHWAFQDERGKLQRDEKVGPIGILLTTKQCVKTCPSDGKRSLVRTLLIMETAHLQAHGVECQGAISKKNIIR